MPPSPSPVGDALCLIGGGHMAEALLAGWLAAGHAPASVTVLEPLSIRREALETRYGVRAVAPETAAPLAGLVVLAVKPQQAAEALAGRSWAPGAVLLSVAAGLSVAALAAALPAGVPVIRSMPNTPALVGAGMTAAYAAPDTPASARTAAEALLGRVGRVEWLDDEALLDAVTAVSGSGPAYFFLLTEALAEAGAAQGLPPALAERLARQTLIGSGQLLAARAEPAATLRAQVTSRGGTTEAALMRLESGGLRALVREAVAQATARSRELGALLAAAPAHRE